MTQEEKQLLLIDLCARLPYGVKGIRTYNENEIVELDLIIPKCKINLNAESETFSELEFTNLDCCPINKFKPYLRPMSSMTEEEKKEREMYRLVRGGWTDEGFDWLNKKMFDYRGLIPMSLALEAPKDMY